VYEWQGDAAAPDFDLALASSYQGKYILIGVSYYTHVGEFVEQIQMHGVIDSVSNAGMSISLRGVRDGETWLMPPNLDSVSEAKPGIYSLRSTGEEIENPDLLATWNVTKPQTR
jgi:uncharacterized UPF0146 family protein